MRDRVACLRELPVPMHGHERTRRDPVHLAHGMDHDFGHGIPGR